MRLMHSPTSPMPEVARLWQQCVARPGDLDHTLIGWVQPILEVLGHNARAIPTERASQHPLPSAAYLLGSTGESDPAACMIAVTWDQNLDQPDQVRSDVRECGVNVAPAFQIYRLLHNTGVPWGILTNGREWRLYHHDTAPRLDVYYAVELPALLQIADAEGETDALADAASWFSRFFHRTAFDPSTGWLSELLESSQVYRDSLGRRLSDRAANALRLLAQGFLDFPSNSLHADPATLKQLYDHSLVVLYWLLFVLYAESQSLLPVGHSRAYQDTYSLHALVREIAYDVREKRPAVASMDRYWAHVCRLWDVLQNGNPDLGLPPHAATLFDRRRYPFLTENAIGDSHLREAVYTISQLTDDGNTDSAVLVYQDLSVRQLGTIYEQLLGYRVAVDDEDGHQLRLVADERARKQTGSYYTPDHVVDWLVERSLGPVLDAAEQRHTAPTPAGLRLRTSRAALAQELLDVKVLDPAAGSGHLLVAATDYIAHRLTALGLADAKDLGTQSEIAYWRRRVAQTCIYGVDVNPLAVELARLSLWALATEPGQPLTFLDHHLRCGNSLIGARVADMHLDTRVDASTDVPQRSAISSNRQLSMLDDPAFAASMRQAANIISRVSNTVEATGSDPQRASRTYREQFQPATRRYRRLADIWTARDFGLPVGTAVWSQILSQTLDTDGDPAGYAEIIAQAEELAHSFRFLHWELEFPNVFFPEASHRAGFDVAIGNPPYLFGEQIPEAHKRFFENHYQLATGQYDLYWLFYERTLSLLNPGGRHGFIVPDAVLARDEVAALRRVLLHDYRLDAVAVGGRVFDDPGIGNVLLTCHKHDTNEPRREDESDDGRMVDVWSYDGDQWIHARSLPLSAAENAPGHRLWVELDPRALELLTRIRRDSRPLRDFARVSRGEELGRRHLRTISAGQTDTVPVLIGADIEPLRPPQPTHTLPEALVKKHPSTYQPPKLVVVKTGSAIRCTLDRTGYVMLQSVYSVSPYTTCRLDPAYLAALLSSSLLSWYLQVTVTGYKSVFPQLNQSNVAALPIRPVAFATPPDKRAVLVIIGQRLGSAYVTGRPSTPAALTSFVNRQLRHTPERTDVVHDLLAWLAELALDLNSQRRILRSQAEPFDYLDSMSTCIPFGERFPDAAPVHGSTEDLSAAYHDIDGLRLVPPQGGDAWRLDVRLKLRTPESEWRAWEYAVNGRRIARRWAPAAWLALDADEAAYYTLALEHLPGFVNVGGFPAGRTTTPREKLLATRVPEYDASIDTYGLWQVRRRIRRTATAVQRVQTLIDMLTYRLYGMSPEEAAEFVDGQSIMPHKMDNR